MTIFLRKNENLPFLYKPMEPFSLPKSGQIPENRELKNQANLSAIALVDHLPASC